MTAITNDLPRDRALAEPRDLDLRGKSGSRAIKNSVATAVMWAAFAIAVIPLVWILVTVAVKGGHLILDSTWWTNSQQGVTARREGGGAVHAIQGTLIQGLVTALISVPIGVLTAVYLVEYGRGRFARIVSFMVDILTGVPSIVAALFIYALWVATLGFQRSGFAVALALVLLMIPVIVRSTEEMLKIVPNDLREASYALGVPKWKTILRIVIPTAFGGIVTGIMLSIARVAGETAPLLLTTFLSQSMNENLFSGPQASIPTFVWDQISSGTPASIDRAWAGALVLILVVVLFYGLARLVAKLTAPATE